MRIIVPKTSGFCYGVSMAVKKAEELLKNKKDLAMFGEVVHNPDVISSLTKKGATVINSLEDISQISREKTLLVRAHGVPRSTLVFLNDRFNEVVDMTCPKVKKVHNIVLEESKKGRRIIIIGNCKHPEVIGIMGWCEGDCLVAASVDELRNTKLSGDISVVSQTTFNQIIFDEITNFILSENPNASIFNTICPATGIRQTEIKKLSMTADAVIILGGKSSSNSRKLSEIAGENTISYLVENRSEIDIASLEGLNTLVIAGGSSTPLEAIKETAEYLALRIPNSQIEYLI